MALLSHAEALLAEMAKDHGIARLEFDENNMIMIDLEEFVIAILLSKQRGSFFFLTRLDGSYASAEQLIHLSQFGNFGSPRRQTKMVFEDATGARMLVAEEPGVLPYPDFVRALEEFVAAVERARANSDAAPAQHAETLPSDEMHWIRS
ncbi:MAG TPA: type III secretion system chaperone [Beijerinckiaceae bacterium]|nr:type III secretion system chaperone [Beijerinckiaceae bacterium]HVB89166.1 type III secretion system chaperone [Beijerinckiaceae bacterium]